jgi:hypothetical protein
METLAEHKEEHIFFISMKKQNKKKIQNFSSLDTHLELPWNNHMKHAITMGGISFHMSIISLHLMMGVFGACF